MSLSPWCWTPPGFRHTAQQHAVCQMRQEHPDERVRIGACGCEEHGGHELESGSTTGVSGTARVPESDRIGALSGPASAATDRGLPISPKESDRR